MFPREIEFLVEWRTNRFCDNGKEYALSFKFDNGNWWTVTTWKNEPTKQVIEETKEIIIRSMEGFQRSMKMPTFSLKRIK